MKDQIKKDISTWNKITMVKVSPPVLWDACKAVLRGKIIGYSAHLKRAKQKETSYKEN